MTAICFSDQAPDGSDLLPSGFIRSTVTFRRHDGTEEKRVEVIDQTTGLRYLNEPVYTTAMKCVALMLGLPFFTIAYIGWQLGRAVAVSVGTLARSVSSFVHQSTCGSFYNLAVDLLHEIPATLLQAVWNSVTAPLYMVGMEAAALYGTCSPVRGRVYFAEIEKAWRGGANPRWDMFHKGSDQEKTEAMIAECTSRISPYTFYLAFCFQPYGSVRDSHIVSVEPLVDSR